MAKSGAGVWINVTWVRSSDAISIAIACSAPVNATCGAARNDRAMFAFFPGGDSCLSCIYLNYPPVMHGTPAFQRVGKAIVRPNCLQLALLALKRLKLLDLLSVILALTTPPAASP
jgi:hypothetical protein